MPSNNVYLFPYSNLCTDISTWILLEQVSGLLHVFKQNAPKTHKTIVPKTEAKVTQVFVVWDAIFVKTEYYWKKMPQKCCVLEEKWKRITKLNMIEFWL